MKSTPLTAWLNENFHNGTLTRQQCDTISRAFDDAQKELLVNVYLALRKVQDAQEELKNRINSNDESVWEMMSAIIEALRQENIIIPLHVKARDDPNQQKLDDEYF